MPKSRVKDLVAYAVSRLNIRCTSAINTIVCPRVLFTEIKPNFKKEFKAAFGDYVEANEGTDNTSNACTCACIAFYPAGTPFIKMVTTDHIIKMMNAIAAEE